MRMKKMPLLLEDFWHVLQTYHEDVTQLMPAKRPHTVAIHESECMKRDEFDLDVRGNGGVKKVIFLRFDPC